MEFKEIEEDGEYDLPETIGTINWAARRSDFTTVTVISNDDTATITMGFKNNSDTFTAFPSATVTDGKKIDHGYGCHLMVKVEGITSNPVVLGLSMGK